MYMTSVARPTFVTTRYPGVLLTSKLKSAGGCVLGKEATGRGEPVTV